MTEQVVIERLGRRGEGVFGTASGPAYVAGVLPGEIVKIAPTGADPSRRRLLEVVVESAERVAPICPHFGTCGGCAVQHWQPASYRAWKRDLVVTALRQSGVTAPIADLVDAHGGGRRRIVLHGRTAADGSRLVGFSASNSHQLIAIGQCPILANSLAGALEAARAITESVAGAKPLDIQVTGTDGGLDVDVRGSGPLNTRQTAALARVADEHGLARLTRHGELVAQLRTPTLRIGKASVALPPGAFLQATAEGEAVLARLVRNGCAGSGRVADLFCGLGPFALRLAEAMRVLAVDGDEAALAALTRAAASTRGLKPVETIRRDLFRHPLAGPELKTYDAVIFDPPRHGALAQARALAASQVPIVIAVSCNAGTFARDIGELIRGGYRVDHIIPVDQFRYSAHVEIVARLEK